jgi:pyruvate kinase
VFSKIERPIALNNIDEIIEASYGIMVARGDLGVEIPPQDVPAAQKTIVKKCNKTGRPGT